MTTHIDPVFLLKAIKSREILDLHFKKKSKIFIYASRFLKLFPDKTSIIVQSPSIRGVYYQVLEKNDPIAVTFQTRGFRFHFRSRILETLEFAPPHEEVVPALRISWPKIINESNRRLFYRIGVRLDESIAVRYSRFDYQRNHDSDGARLPKKYEGIEAIMTDISEKGMAIQIKPEEMFEVGSKLKLSFCFKDDNTEVEIKGIVRNIRKSEDLRTHYLGIQFLKQESRNCLDLMQRIASHAVSSDSDKIDFYTLNKIVSKNLMIKKIADGEVNPESVEMLLSRHFPLSYVEYLEVMVFIHKIPAFQQRARRFLNSIPIGVKESYVRERYANDQVVQYLLQESLEKSLVKIVDGISENPFFPVQFLLKIAREGSPDMLNLLIKKKNKLVAYPEIMAVMEKNPKIPSSIRIELNKIREYYVKELQSEKISKDDIIEEFRELPSATVKKGRKELRKKPIHISDRILDLLNRINKMSVPERIRLALIGNRTERFILSKDPNEMVASALLENPDLDSRELQSLIEGRGRPISFIELVIKRDHLLKGDNILLSLIKHPELPLKKVSRVLNEMKGSMLKTVSKDHSINPNIRLMASDLRRLKSKKSK